MSDETVSSVLANQPNVPVLLSRASFRPDVAVRTPQRTQVNRQRRTFLRGVLGFAALSISALLVLKITSFASSDEISTTVPNSGVQTGASQSHTQVSVPNPGVRARTILTNKANIPTNRAMTFNVPTFGPILLIHLDNGQFVAYSSICTHAGCQVQFDPSGKDIACPCHGAVYDPYNNAQVLRGPAPAPLRKIPITFDPSTGNIYLSG
jgi:thiosulfate dehydrogenase [quinone] large subunit